ncbi:hypothetical protein [Sphingobium yanoikuyae]|uniref:hypothetical protein n=1 Tax=Sphingobium yanoikuyae TaxID=13690 RepID=UPI0022DDFD99|nr:hypothetical protein [Sphingobium yanoikuyae]WBQ19238.1 hypothetical protein PAE53_22850 [Sphingobium yanoikuyae]
MLRIAEVTRPIVGQLDKHVLRIDIFGALMLKLLYRAPGNGRWHKLSSSEYSATVGPQMGTTDHGQASRGEARVVSDARPVL